MLQSFSDVRGILYTFLHGGNTTALWLFLYLRTRLSKHLFVGNMLNKVVLRLLYPTIAMRQAQDGLGGDQKSIESSMDSMRMYRFIRLDVQMALSAFVGVVECFQSLYNVV